MEVRPAHQQTLSEFFEPKKAKKVWTIILALLLTGMVLGAAYEFTRPQPDAVRMTSSLPYGTYAYIDVQLLSDWVLDFTGDHPYTYYEVMDPDENWFIISLSKSDYSTLSEYNDAYVAFFTDDTQGVVLPEPTRLTGMTRAISTDDAEQLASYYEVTSTDVTDFFGQYYFEAGTDNRYLGAYYYIFGFFCFGIVFLIVVLTGNSVRVNYRTSTAHLYALGLMDEAENQFLFQNSLRFDRLKLVLSPDFLYSGSTGYVLPYEEVVWLYKSTQRSYGITVATQLVAGTISGKTIYLATRAADDQFITTVAQAVLRKNPTCLIGYSSENIKAFRQRVNAYKTNKAS